MNNPPWVYNKNANQKNERSWSKHRLQTSVIIVESVYSVRRNSSQNYRKLTICTIKKYKDKVNVIILNVLTEMYRNGVANFYYGM